MNCCDNPKKESYKTNRRSHWRNIWVRDPVTKEQYQEAVQDGYDVTVIEYCSNCSTEYRTYEDRE